jgi:hypothetical protein
MSDANLEAVLERLDRMEQALLKLVSLVEQQGLAPRQAPPQAPQAAAAAAPPPTPSHEPPRIHVAPLPGRPAMPHVASEPQPARAPQAESNLLDPWAHLDITVPGPEGTVDDVIARVFEAALESDPERTWAALTRLSHSTQIVGPRAIDHFKGFAWQRLRRNARGYLADPNNPRTYQIAYTDPREPTGRENEVRCFIRAGDNRMPVPLGLARDPVAQNAWRVTMMSL